MDYDFSSKGKYMCIAAVESRKAGLGFAAIC